MEDDLKAILKRIADGQQSQDDLDVLLQAYRAGQIAIATGERAVAMGRDANDAIIVTGDNNLVMVLPTRVAETMRTLPFPDPEAPIVMPPRPEVNPFVYGPAVPPERFYGRTKQRADVKNRIGGVSAQSIAIVGMRRSGKSSLLRYVRERIAEFCPDDQRPLPVSINLQDQRFHTPAGLIEGLRRSIEHQTGTPPWQSDHNADSWAVSDGLETLRDSGRRLIVLIDEFERIGARLDQFRDWGEDWRAKISDSYMALVIAAIRPVDEIYQICGLTSPFGNVFTTTYLSAFEPTEWQTLVHEGFARGGRRIIDLEWIDELAGGLPFYTQMAAALLWQHGDHARARAAFEQQAGPRFAELWDDLTSMERQALRHAASAPGAAAPNSNLRAVLQRYGLLRSNGQLFSSVFAEFVRAQR